MVLTHLPLFNWDSKILPSWELLGSYSSLKNMTILGLLPFCVVVEGLQDGDILPEMERPEGEVDSPALWMCFLRSPHLWSLTCTITLGSTVFTLQKLAIHLEARVISEQVLLGWCLWQYV